MLNKIPEELKLIISRKFEKDDWNLDRLLKEFQSELETRERIAAVSDTPRATSSSIQNKPRALFPTAAALLSQQEGKFKLLRHLLRVHFVVRNTPLRVAQ